MTRGPVPVPSAGAQPAAAVGHIDQVALLQDLPYRLGFLLRSRKRVVALGVSRVAHDKSPSFPRLPISAGRGL